MPKFELPSSVVLAKSGSGHWCAAAGRKTTLGNLRTRTKGNSAFLLPNTSHLAFSPNEELLITKNTSGELVLVAVPGLEIIATRKGVYEEGSEIHFSACGEYLVDGSWWGRLAVSRVADLGIERAWNYDGEMLASVSFDESRSSCLVAHQPKSVPGRTFADPAYLNIWEWPFDSDPRRIDPRLDILYAAEISPKGTYVAVCGHSRTEGKTVLRLITSEGEIRATRTVEIAPNRLRWLTPDALVMVLSSAYTFYLVPELRVMSKLDIEYASDAVVLNDGSEILIGTTRKGYLLPWTEKA